jgi:hypothetical protein
MKAHIFVCVCVFFWGEGMNSAVLVVQVCI